MAERPSLESYQKRLYLGTDSDLLYALQFLEHDSKYRDKLAYNFIYEIAYFAPQQLNANPWCNTGFEFPSPRKLKLNIYAQ